MAGYAAHIPIGVYREGSDIANIRAYEAFLGMTAGATVQFVVDGLPDKPVAWKYLSTSTTLTPISFGEMTSIVLRKRCRSG